MIQWLLPVNQHWLFTFKYVLQIMEWNSMSTFFLNNRTSKFHGRWIFEALLDCLQLYSMTETSFSCYLVSVACSDAAVMLGRKSGVARLFLMIVLMLMKMLIISLYFVQYPKTTFLSNWFLGHSVHSGTYYFFFRRTAPLRTSDILTVDYSMMYGETSYIFWVWFAVCCFDVTDPYTNFHQVVDCARNVMREHCYWPLVSDLNNVLSHRSVAVKFMSDDSLLEMWFAFLSMFQGDNRAQCLLCLLMTQKYSRKHRTLEQNIICHYCCCIREETGICFPCFTQFSFSSINFHAI
jgi:hypothetical protein